MLKRTFNGQFAHYLHQIFVIFVMTTGWAIATQQLHGGKSGQPRAAHHLTGGVPVKRDTESATENDRQEILING